MTENGVLKHDGEVPFNFSDIIQNEQIRDDQKKNWINHQEQSIVEGTGGSGTSEITSNLWQAMNN